MPSLRGQIHAARSRLYWIKDKYPQVAEGIKFLNNWLRHFREFEYILHVFLTEATKKNIIRKTSPTEILYGYKPLAGQKFKRLSETTLKIREQKGLGRRQEFILQETGRLLNKIKIEVNEYGNIQTFGVNPKIVKAHSFGASGLVFGKIPMKIFPRPFIGVSKGDLPRLETLLQIFFTKLGS